MLPAWELLDRRCPPDSVYQTRNFLLPWLKYASAKRALELTLVWSGDKLVAIAPLVADNIGMGPVNLNRIGLATYGDYSPTLDLRLDEKQAPEALTTLLSYGGEQNKRWNLLVLRQLSGNSAALKYLPDVTKSLNYGFLQEPARREGVLHLHDDWDTYFQRLGRKHRKELLRGDRALENTSEWRISHEWVAESDAPDSFNAYRAVVESSWKKSHANDSSLLALLKDLFLGFSKNGDLLISKLENDAGCAAAIMQLRYGNSLFGFHMAYADDCAFRGPGTVLLGHSIKLAYREKFSAYDFSTADPNFHRWCPNYRNTSNIYISRNKLLMPVFRYLLAKKSRRNKRQATLPAA